MKSSRIKAFMQNRKSIDASRIESISAKSTTGNATELTLPCRQAAPITWTGFPCRQTVKIATLRAFVQESQLPPSLPGNRHQKRPSRFPAEEIQDSPAERQPLQRENWAQSRRRWRNLGHLLSYPPHSSPLHRSCHRPLQQKSAAGALFPQGRQRRKCQESSFFSA